MADIRLGVIGLRRGRSFVRACDVVGGATVTSLYDIDAQRLGVTAAELGLRGFTDFADFLAANIDAVIIASPLPFHAEQASAALAAGCHVLSEVTACNTLDQARALVRAAEASSAIYMLAENYRYLDEVELVKRLAGDDRFGSIYYGEGEYLHDCRELWRDEAGELTWRGRGELGCYCTHSLGPLLYITGDRVASVSATAVPGGQFDPEVTRPAIDLLHLTTDGGRVFRVRIDSVSPRPHQMAYYALQGTMGSYESWRGLGDQSKVWFADEHEPSRLRPVAQWHPLADYASRYAADRLDAPPEAGTGGHGNSEYWMLRDFLAAVRGEMASPIDVMRALDYTLPGILARESQAQQGAPVTVPDPRTW